MTTRGDAAANVEAENTEPLQPGRTGTVRRLLSTWEGNVVLGLQRAFAPDPQPAERIWRQWLPDVTHSHVRANIEDLIEDSDRWFVRQREAPGAVRLCHQHDDTTIDHITASFLALRLRVVLQRRLDDQLLARPDAGPFQDTGGPPDPERHRLQCSHGLRGRCPRSLSGSRRVASKTCSEGPLAMMPRLWNPPVLSTLREPSCRR